MLPFSRFFILFILFSLASPHVTAANTSRDKPAPRIISLAPHITELVYAAGGGESLVGVSAYSDYPEMAQNLTIVGDAFRIDLEQLLLLDADAVIYWHGNTSLTVMQQLEKHGFKLIPVEINNLSDIAISLRKIAEYLSLPEPESAKLLEAKLNKLKQTIRPSQRAFIQLSEQPIYTVSGTHWMSEAASLCGLSNIFPTLATTAATVSKEAVIVANPQVIIRTQELTDHSPLLQWPQIDAIKYNRIVTLNPNTFSRPTPRITQAIDDLCRQVDQFSGDFIELESN